MLLQASASNKPQRYLKAKPAHKKETSIIKISINN